MNREKFSRGGRMSGNLWLDWLTLSVSIFNTIIMLWMGLMILLSSDKRTWGVWLAAGGLLAGSLFFVSHTAIIGQEISFFTPGTNFWWHVGWGPVVAAPFGWYIVMLWFSGYWENVESNLHIRHKAWLSVTIIYAILLIVLFIFLNPLSSLSPRTNIDYESGPAFTGIPLLFIAYPVFIFMCIALSMDTLIRPGPTGRFMGEQAREKARSWLVGASFILLVVAVLVGFAILWVLQNAQQSIVLPELYGNIAPTLGVMDLILSILIGAVVLLVGQAIVSYGIFTGKPLPRSVFKRQWIYAIIMSVIVAITFAGSLQIKLSMVYSLLLAAILLGAFFAWITWRYLIERDNAIHQVRPILTSPKLLPMIMKQSGNFQIDPDLLTSFQVLARDILEVDRALLAPREGSPSLDIKPLYYPVIIPTPDIHADIFAKISKDSRGIGVPLQAVESSGFTWLVPLWSERGLNGMLFLGAKEDGSFISQEEIELGRAACERMLDIATSAELSNRLIKLQQLRFSEQSIIDQRPRRVLHDEVLPTLHSAMLQISRSEKNKESTLLLLSNTHRMISNLLKELPSAYSPQFEHIGLTQAIRKLTIEEFSLYFNKINYQWEEIDEIKLNDISQLKKEVMYYAAREAIRNSALHANPTTGEEKVTLTICITTSTDINIIVQDNGSGVRKEKDPSTGSGQGLAIHSTLMELIGGRLSIESEPGSFTRVSLTCPF
jgi:signal transduction histidine kinase